MTNYFRISKENSASVDAVVKRIQKKEKYLEEQDSRLKNELIAKENILRKQLAEME